MAKIKEITVEVKKSHNYQTFTAAEVISIEDTDDVESVRREAMCRCRKQVMEQLDIEQKADASAPKKLTKPVTMFDRQARPDSEVPAAIEAYRAQHGSRDDKKGGLTL